MLVELRLVGSYGLDLDDLFCALISCDPGDYAVRLLGVARPVDLAPGARYGFFELQQIFVQVARDALLEGASGLSSTATARLPLMVWVAFPRLRLSCESERLSLADSSNVGVGPREKASDGFTAPPRSGWQVC